MSCASRRPDGTVSAYLKYWLNGVAVHQVRKNTHTRYAAYVRLHLNLNPGLGLGLGAKKLARLTARDIRTFLDGLRATCQCCAHNRDSVRRSCCAIGQCCGKLLSPLTVTYVHAVLKNGLVFTTPKGRPLDPTNLTRRFRRLLRSAGLRTIRFRDLRHSTATLLLGQGIDLVVIKELLGHAHIGVTADVYVHVRLQRQAIDTLGDALSPTDDDPDAPPTAAVVR